jgi:hypothetical protein
MSPGPPCMSAQPCAGSGQQLARQRLCGGGRAACSRTGRCAGPPSREAAARQRCAARSPAARTGQRCWGRPGRASWPAGAGPAASLVSRDGWSQRHCTRCPFVAAQRSRLFSLRWQALPAPSPHETIASSARSAALVLAARRAAARSSRPRPRQATLKRAGANEFERHRCEAEDNRQSIASARGGGKTRVGGRGSMRSHPIDQSGVGEPRGARGKAKQVGAPSLAGTTT